MARIVPAVAFALLLSGGAAVAHGSSLRDRDVYQDQQTRIASAFHRAVTEYDSAIARAPADVLLAIKRCEIIDSYSYLEDVFIEAAAKADESCVSELNEQYPGHPEVELYRLRSTYDDEIEDVVALHDAGLSGWNRSQHARLHVYLAERYRYSGESSNEAGDHCIEALELDIAADCRVDAAMALESRGDTAGAVQLLTSPLDPNTGPGYLLTKTSMLAKLGAHDSVAAFFDQLSLDDIAPYQLLSLATDLLHAGMLDEAAKLLEQTPDDHWQQDVLFRTKFRLALARREYNEAAAHYDEWRDLGFGSDPFLRARLELAIADPGQPWRARDLFGALAIIGATAMIGAVTLMLPAMIHYRGLARRLKGLNAAAQQYSWSLRQAWYVLFALIFGSTFILYWFEYDFLTRMFVDATGAGDAMPDVDLPRLLIADTFLFAVLLLPLVLYRRKWKILGAQNWPVLRCIAVGFGCALLFRVLFLLLHVVSPQQGGAGNTFIIESAMIDTYREYGAFALFAVVALVTPLIEEIGFRGVLLHAFQRHVSFTGSNLIQSAVFAGLHEGIWLMPGYFAFAVTAGILARRSGGLLSAIVMHVTFNAIATGVIVSGLAPGPA